MELSVKDYSELIGITIQGVYKRIKKGSVQTITRDGRKLVIVDSEEVKPVSKPMYKPYSDKFLKKLVKKLNKKIDKKDLLIQRLNKSLERCGKSKEKVLIQYITELKELKEISAPAPVEDNVIDVNPKKGKKNKRGKKKK